MGGYTILFIDKYSRDLSIVEIIKRYVLLAI